METEQTEQVELKPPVEGEQTEQTEQKIDPGTEREARAMGWVPEGEWKGDPPKHGFKSAAEFVQRGNEVLPIVNKRLKEENETLKGDLAKLEKETAAKIDNINRMSKVALDRQRKQIEADFEARKEAAVEVGDKAAYKEADKAGKEALAEFDKAAAEPEKKAEEKTDKFDIPESVKKTVEGWVSENDWFKSDEEMNAVANARHSKLLKEKPGLTLAENLAEVRAYVQKRFPEKFADDDDEPKRGSPVEGGSRVNGAGTKSVWSRLPKDAQSQADRFIKEDGLFLEKGETIEKDLQKARDRYAREYLGEQA
jgi:hypothetical protein